MAYASSAGAAGVGLLALAQPLAAEVVYTHTHKAISVNTTLPLDLNNDGTDDFTFSNTSNGGAMMPATGSTNDVTGLRIIGGNTNRFAWNTSRYVKRIKAGQEIGRRNAFATRPTGVVARCEVHPDSFSRCYGPWVHEYFSHPTKGLGGYVGLRFAIGGETHYGWARLKLTIQGNFLISALLKGYAYETIPRKTIVAGDTGAMANSLGHLASGAANRKPASRY